MGSVGGLGTLGQALLCPSQAEGLHTHHTSCTEASQRPVSGGGVTSFWEKRSPKSTRLGKFWRRPWFSPEPTHR